MAPSIITPFPGASPGRATNTAATRRGSKGFGLDLGSGGSSSDLNLHDPCCAGFSSGGGADGGESCSAMLAWGRWDSTCVAIGSLLSAPRTSRMEDVFFTRRPEEQQALVKKVDNILHPIEIDAASRTTSLHEGVLKAPRGMSLLSVSTDIDLADAEVPSYTVEVAELTPVTGKRGTSIRKARWIVPADSREDSSSVPEIKAAFGDRACNAVAVKWRENGAVPAALIQHRGDGGTVPGALKLDGSKVGLPISRRPPKVIASISAPTAKGGSESPDDSGGGGGQAPDRRTSKTASNPQGIWGGVDVVGVVEEGPPVASRRKVGAPERASRLKHELPSCRADDEDLVESFSDFAKVF